MSLNKIKGLHEDCVEAVQNEDIKMLITSLQEIESLAREIRNKLLGEQATIIKRMAPEIIIGSNK